MINAEVHGAGPVTLSVEDGDMVVDDSGPGIAAADRREALRMHGR